MKSKLYQIALLSLCMLLLSGLFACVKPGEETVESYMVTFSRNTEVTVTGMPSPQNIEEGKLVTRPTSDPSTSLYEFTGWFADEACTTPFDFDTVTVTSRLTIYAGWELIITTFDVTFDLNYEGSSDPTVIHVNSGEKVVEPDEPIRPGYQFKFWSTQADAEYIFNFDNSITSDTPLYAMWEKIYTLTYIFNVEDMPSVDETYGDTELTIRPTDPTRSNFSFAGWFSDSALTIPFTHGALLSESTSIYAKWTRISYKVTFDLNYTGSTPIIINANVGADVPVPTSPSREGYAFDNWYTSATNQTDDTLYDFSAVTNDTTIIYAGWKQLYTVTFDYHYESAPANTTQTIQEGEEINVITPTREGYNFSGWYIDIDLETPYDYSAVTSSFTLYAKWIDVTQTQDEFTVTFDINDGTSDPIIRTVPADTVVSKPDDPVRAGYQFMGWVTTPTGSTTYKFTPVTEDITVYARWINLWKITFNLDYEGAPDPLVVETLDGTRISKPENPTREGLWQFVRWNDENTQPFVFTTIIKQDYELHAVWARSGYTITWDFNFDGEPSPVTTEVLIGSVIREPQKPDREGNWAISGWYLDEELTTPFSLTSEIDDDITLYAKWASGYSYSINLNYVGAPSIPTQILSEGANIPARPQDPTRTNYTFVGWSSAPSNDPDFNDFGQPITQDITIYAQWQHTYIFEAEYVDLSGKMGAGWSGGAAGTAMIVRDTITEDPELGTNAYASNGFFLSYLYSYGLYIDFVVTSDRAAEATLIFRFSAEQKDPFMITDEQYRVTLNGEKVNYGSITIFGAYAALQQRKLPFDDVMSVTVDLVEGVNTIRFTTNNQISMGGTMDATAPLFDCIKLDTIAVLTWNPVLENLSLFN